MKLCLRDEVVIAKIVWCSFAIGILMRHHCLSNEWKFAVYDLITLRRIRLKTNSSFGFAFLEF